MSGAAPWLVRWGLATSLGLALTGACIGTSPEAAREANLGPEQPGVPQGPTHRAGQPCLTCHSEQHDPGGEHFLLAGTVYRRAGDPEGLEGAEVVVADAAGRRFTARTNRVGTFFVREGGSGEPTQRGDGELHVPFRPTYPLRVKVVAGDVEQVMQGLIWREGSCAACHGGEPSASSNGWIYLEAATP